MLPNQLYILILTIITVRQCFQNDYCAYLASVCCHFAIATIFLKQTIITIRKRQSNHLAVLAKLLPNRQFTKNKCYS